LKSIIKLHNEINIKNFFSQYRYVYIYGAGEYGKCCAECFMEYNISFKGYVVSNKTINWIDEIPVYSYDEIYRELGDNDCLVLAMKKIYQLEVLNIIGNEFNGQLIDITSYKYFYYRLNRECIEFLDNLSQKYPPATYDNNDFSNILVIRLDRIGDMIWTSAFFRELRRNFPRSRITAVCEKSVLSLLCNCPYVDRVIGYKCSQEEKTGRLMNMEQLIRASEFAKSNLCDSKYDVVFLPRGIQNKEMMSNIFLAVCSSAPIRIAGYYATSDKIEAWYRESMSKLFSVIAEHRYPLHEVEKALNVLKAIDCHIKEDDTEIWYKNNQMVADMNMVQIRELRKKFDYLIAIGLTSQSSARTWSPQKYKELFGKIDDKFSVCFLLFGDTNAQKEASIAFDDKCCLDFTGKTNLNDVMQLMSICDIYLGSNTGLEHIAAAMKKPVVEISVAFPWADDNVGLSPQNCGAWKTKHVVVCPAVPQDEACAKTGFCVNDSPHCINNVSVESVYNVLSGFLKNYMFTNN